MDQIGMLPPNRQTVSGSPVCSQPRGGGTPLKANGGHRRDRGAEYQASAILTTEGFAVIRTQPVGSPWNLVAWRGTQILIIHIRTTCDAAVCAATVSSRFCSTIELLRRSPVIPGSVPQFWIRCREGWFCYIVLPGGIAEVTI